MKRYEFRWGHPVSNIDGEWIRYEDHCEAMKRIAAPSASAQGCTRSHPHENLSAECQQKTVEARAAFASAQQAEPVAWHIGNADGSINKIGAVYIRRSLAEKHIESYEGELDACIVPLYAAPAPSASPASVPQGVVAWVRRGEDGILREEFLSDRAIEQVRRQSGGWLPMVLAAAQQSAASPADQAEEAREVCGLKPGCCHKCGLPLSQNPHPEAGKPDHYLQVGCPRECIPCTVKGRHNWASEAMKNQRDAARYRWLRDHESWEPFDSKFLNAHDLYGRDSADMDNAIDAAMSASKESPDA